MKLIMSQDEKDMAWCEASDELLASILRYVLVHHNKYENKDDALQEVLAASGILHIFRLMFLTNAAKYTQTVDDVEYQGELLGDYKVTCVKVDKDGENKKFKKAVETYALHATGLTIDQLPKDRVALKEGHREGLYHDINMQTQEDCHEAVKEIISLYTE